MVAFQTRYVKKQRLELDKTASKQKSMEKKILYCFIWQRRQNPENDHLFSVCY